MNIKPRTGRRNYAKGGEVEENPNPWESDYVQRYWDEHNGMGHLDRQKSPKVFGKEDPYKIPDEPPRLDWKDFQERKT